VGEQSKRYVVACVEFDDFHGVYIHTHGRPFGPIILILVQKGQGNFN